MGARRSLSQKRGRHQVLNGANPGRSYLHGRFKEPNGFDDGPKEYSEDSFIATYPHNKYIYRTTSKKKLSPKSLDLFTYLRLPKKKNFST